MPIGNSHLRCYYLLGSKASLLNKVLKPIKKIVLVKKNLKGGRWERLLSVADLEQNIRGGNQD